MSANIRTKQSLKEYIQSYISTQLNELELTDDQKDEDEDDLLLDDFDEEDTEDTEPSDELSPDSSDEDNEIMEKGEVETDDIIEKLNTIRSGRSFKDSSVKDELEQYVDELDTAEKTALFALLKGIAQIVTKEISGNDATEPSDDSPNIEMTKSNIDDSGGEEGGDDDFDFGDESSSDSDEESDNSEDELGGDFDLDDESNSEDESEPVSKPKAKSKPKRRSVKIKPTVIRKSSPSAKSFRDDEEDTEAPMPIKPV